MTDCTCTAIFVDSRNAHAVRNELNSREANIGTWAQNSKKTVNGCNTTAGMTKDQRQKNGNEYMVQCATRWRTRNVIAI